jgi:carbamoyl-phosphate synthase large subunit
VLVRPSYVLGGQRMRILYDAERLGAWLGAQQDEPEPRDVLIDAFLEDAFEYDVDALCDGERAVIAGILEHVEEAGVHSGDSSALLPPQKVKPGLLEAMREATRALGLRLGVRGLMNVQFAEKDGVLYVLEVNPRASRTVPFLAKALGLPLVQLATRLMLGETLDDVGLVDDPQPRLVFAKVPVFPFAKFPGVDVLLGPEMRSTGEVMGVGRSAGEAYHKALEAAGVLLPEAGTIFLSVNDRDKENLVPVARRLAALGFELVATRGTALRLFDAGVPSQMVYKVDEGSPNARDWVREGRLKLVIDTPLGSRSRRDEKAIRVAAAAAGIPVITTLTAAEAAVEAMEMRRRGGFERFALQDFGLAGALRR